MIKPLSTAHTRANALQNGDRKYARQTQPARFPIRFTIVHENWQAFSPGVDSHTLAPHGMSSLTTHSSCDGWACTSTTIALLSPRIG